MIQNTEKVKASVHGLFHVNKRGTEKETESEKGSMTPTNDDEARRKQARDEWMAEIRGTK